MLKHTQKQHSAVVYSKCMQKIDALNKLADTFSNDAENVSAINLIARWVRPPIQKPGEESVCPYTGLKHAAFYSAFCRNPRIKQVRLGTGKTRGTRLLWLPDIYAELNRIADQQKEEVNPSSE